MADEQELRRVNWTEVFSFTHIFKSFRMATYRNSILLALAAVVLVYLVGRGMDAVWGLWGGAAQVGDVYALYQAPNGEAFDKALEARRNARAIEVARLYSDGMRAYPDYAPVRQAYSRPVQGGSNSSPFGIQFNKVLTEQKKTTPPVPTNIEQQARDDWEDVWENYEETIEDMLDGAAPAISKARDLAEEDIKKLPKDQERQARKQLESDVVAARRAVWVVRRDMIDRPKEQIVGRGPFAVLLNYESQAFANAIGSVLHGDFFTGWGRLMAQRGSMPAAYVPAGPAFPADLTADAADAPGFFAWVFLMLWGVIYLLSAFPVYAVIFLVIALAVWAVFGGAVARIAALHAAREEKISMSLALRFSVGKFLSYLGAPLIPLAIIVVLGLLLGLAGLVGSFPVGDIIVSILFFGALILGALVAFLAIGLLAGAPLMYPTIAVEGSDAFDAISRSFSYIFARPWRYALYVVVSVIYGTVTYLFVRLFAFLLLLATHFFMANGLFGTGMSINSAPELAEGASKMDLLWTKPTFTHLATPMNSAAMGWNETLASLFIHIWVYLVVSLVAAYVLSYLVSSFTVMYYLLRRKVDATDLDDVYVEEPAEETPAEPTTTVPVSETPPAGEAPAPPTQPPAEGEAPPQA